MTRGLLVGTAVAIAGMVASGALGHYADWEYEGTNLEYWKSDGGTGGAWLGYTSMLPTMGHGAFANGMGVYGTGATDDLANNAMFAIRGGDYRGETNAGGRGSRLVVYGTAHAHSAWDSAIQSIESTFRFGLSFGTGQVDVYNVSTSFFLFDEDHNFMQGIGSGLAEPGLGSFEPGGHGVQTELVDRFTGDVSMGHMFHWQAVIWFDWSGADADDVLTYTASAGGPTTLEVVPAPASAMALGIAAIRRRRR